MTLDSHEGRAPTAPLRSVLVVEDQNAPYRTLERSLRRRGWRCARARSVAEARASLSEDFDAVVIDLDLGDGGRGEDVLELLAARSTPVATIVLSGCAKHVGANTLGLDGVPYLEKPPDAARFFATLDEELELTRIVIARGLVGLVAKTEKAVLRAMRAKLRATGGNQCQAAHALGLPRTTLRDKMDVYGLKSAEFKRPKK